MKWRCYLESLELAHLLVDTLLDKRGDDIVLLDLREHAVFADYFLICNGENERQLRTLAEHVTVDAKRKGGVLAMGSEGEAAGGWILIDFGDLVVHLFSPEKRNYYRLEDIWNKAHIVVRMQ